MMDDALFDVIMRATEGVSILAGTLLALVYLIPLYGKTLFSSSSFLSSDSHSFFFPKTDCRSFLWPRYCFWGCCTAKSTRPLAGCG